jgi:UDP-GlcNAc:undecaprenyl-phosphate GlcNAc-1-phosphate transferase
MIGWIIGILVLPAFVISALAGRLFMRVAEATDMLDRPGAHKAHGLPTPLLGGCAIFSGILIPAVLALVLVAGLSRTGGASWIPASLSVHLPGAMKRLPAAAGILALAGVLHVMGLRDDRKGLGPWFKLGVQILVAGVTVLALQVRVMQFAGPVVSSMVSILWIVVITNALNFLDNMDGLSAGVAAICAGILLLAAAQMGQIFVSAWLALLLGALLGFLPYNFAPARMFMGDAGSLVIGYLLAVLTCLTTYTSPDASTHFLYGVFAPLVLLAVPLYDSLSVTILRIRAGLSPMVGDRRHFSHRLVKRGMTVRNAVLTIWLCTLATGMGALLLVHVAGAVSATLVFLQTLAVLGIIALLEWGGGPS